jgi:hypothetical protein
MSLSIGNSDYSDISSVIPTSICWGCENDQPGQQAHMEFGGCLYRSISFDDESVNISESI